MADPYQPPEAQLGAGRGATLYSVNGVVIGTVLGSLAAGLFMMYLNYRALGKAALARKLAVWGSVIYVVLISLSALIPGTMSVSLIVIVAQAALAYFVAESLQGAAIRYHAQHQGALHSGFRAAGVGLLTGLALIFLLMTATLLLAALTGSLAPAA